LVGKYPEDSVVTTGDQKYEMYTSIDVLAEILKVTGSGMYFKVSLIFSTQVVQLMIWFENRFKRI
jgi:hypothetical protein